MAPLPDSVRPYPIDIGRERGSGPPTLRPSLQSPQANGTLEVRATALKGLVVHVNDLADIVLREEATVEVASRGLNIGS